MGTRSPETRAEQRRPDTVDTVALKLTPKEKAMKALELKKVGFSWRKIADQLGYRTGSGAFGAVQQLLKSESKASVDEMRQMDNEVLDDLLKALQKGIRAGAPRSIEVAVRILERRARMWGLDEVDRPKEVVRTAPVTFVYAPHADDDSAKEFFRDVLLGNGNSQYQAGPDAHPALQAPIEGTLVEKEEDLLSWGDG